jgi:hypothetical protein
MAGFNAHAEIKVLFCGKYLFDLCMSKSDTLEDLFCNLYISGFVHGAMIAAANGKSDALCLPEGFTGDEARAIFLRTMRHLEEPKLSFLMGARADLSLAGALHLAFPCDAKKLN